MEKKVDSAPATRKRKTSWLMKGRKSTTLSNSCVFDEVCAHIGGGSKCALAVLPVKVKSKRSDRYVKTYVFMDPGSTTSSGTEDLLRKLKLRGRKTQILLNRMGCSRANDSKVLKMFVLSDLEVCGVEEDVYIDLPSEAHSFIPVQKENIPKQEILHVGLT